MTPSPLAALALLLFASPSFAQKNTVDFDNDPAFKRMEERLKAIKTYPQRKVEKVAPTALVKAPSAELQNRYDALADVYRNALSADRRLFNDEAVLCKLGGIWGVVDAAMKDGGAPAVYYDTAQTLRSQSIKVTYVPAPPNTAARSKLLFRGDMLVHVDRPNIGALSLPSPWEYRVSPNPWEFGLREARVDEMSASAPPMRSKRCTERLNCAATLDGVTLICLRNSSCLIEASVQDSRGLPVAIEEGKQSHQFTEYVRFENRARDCAAP